MPSHLLRLDRLFTLEFALFLLLGGIALLCPMAFNSMRRRIEGTFRSLANRPMLFLGLVAVLAFSISAAVGFLVQWPIPKIHDEFSYLLAGDTYAHGRLSNPTPDFWQHFETFHELMRPTYASKYPPGQGLSLALGSCLFGDPAWGVWLVMAAFVAATTWCIGGWLPPRWAIVGGLLALFRFAGFGYWSQSYWGGGVAALGGALVLGGLPRVWKKPRISSTMAMALGFVLMALSRPLEGLILSFPIIVALLWRCIHPPNGKPKDWFLRLLLPIFLVQSLNIFAISMLNKAVTGDATVFPFQIYQREYVSYPLFVFQETAKPKAWRHWVWLINHYAHLANTKPDKFSDLVSVKLRECRWFSEFFLGFSLLIPFLFSLAKGTQKKTRIIQGLAALVFIVVLLEVETSPRKFAPAACLPLLISLMGIRQLRCWRQGIPHLGKNIAMVCVLTPLLSSLLIWHPWFIDKNSFPWAIWRNRVKCNLESSPGKDLVFVQYRPKRHFPHFEWVYNEANLDSTEVLWARKLSPKSNAQLAKRYSGRHLWLLDADGDVSVKPYRIDAAEEP